MKREFLNCLFIFLLVPVVSYCQEGTIAIDGSCSHFNYITEMTVDINESFSDINELGFSIQFDAEKLEYVNCFSEELEPDGGWDTFTCTVTNPGELTVYAFSENSSIEGGSTGNLMALEFCLTWSSGVQGDTTPLSLSDLSYDLENFNALGGAVTVRDH